MQWIKCLLIAFICFTVIVQVHSSGNFELRLKYFSNENGRDSEGHCCSGATDAATGKCIGTCKTRFRVCLKHYQATIDTTSQCTYGDEVTPILGENSFNLSTTGDAQSYQNKDFTNPIQFAFNFAWPGTFTLIVEAWHDTNNSANAHLNNLLIQRLSVQQVLEVSSEWKSNKSESQHNTWLEYDFRVTCDAHYYGAGCANLCRPRDDQFGHYTCSETGEIICLTGWQSTYCEKPKCAKGCVHGQCEKPNQCICQKGWRGALCDECAPYPNCVHGTCDKPWTCICQEGWGGLFCNQDLNYCTNHRPCQNGGTCYNTGQGLYTCQCAPGFRGNDCQTVVNSCDHENPCQNGGSCLNEDTPRGYKCACSKGWSGRLCEEKLLTCADHPCHHGKCRNTSGSNHSKQGFQCDCPSGYSGLTCELHQDNCNPNPCQNGGSCQPNGKCSCPDGYAGAKCEQNIDDCVGHKCQNGGTCIDLVNQYRCQCVPGFHGTRCSSKVDLCLTKPCANGGSCTNLNNDYQCACRAGFTGKDCSIDIDECSSAPCHNGGTCMNRVNSFECVCANGFRGKQCDEESFAYDSVTYDARHQDGGAASQQPRADGLTNAQVVLIAIFSVAMPLVAVIAACVVFCMKRKRKRAQEKDDAEARKQNEQNAVATLHHNGSGVGVGVGLPTGTLGGVKRGSSGALAFDNSNPNIIKNTWDKSVNNICASAAAAAVEDCRLYSGALANYAAAADNNANSEFCGVGQITPLQRAKSQKQLNTDPTLMHRASQLMSASVGAAAATAAAAAAAAAAASAGTTKDYSAGGAEAKAKRISVLGEGSYCSQRWPSLAAAGVAGACSSQLMAAASATGSGAATTQRTVVCGTPHM